MSFEQKNEFSVNGMMRIKEDLVADTVHVNGMMKVSKDVEANEVICNGMLKVDGKMKSKNINVNGFLSTSEIETDDCTIDGAIKCSLINCENLNLTLESKCHIKEIEAGNVEVKAKKVRKFLVGETISADHIDIENVKCDKVSGDVVKIGPNCKIKKVEYKTQLEIHPKAFVMEQERL